MKGLKLAAFCLALGLGAALPSAEAGGQRRETSVRSPSGQEAQHRKPHRGQASFYANHFHGKRMANGKRFRRNSDSAASRTLPLGTRARVKNLENGRTAMVTIEDRGPFKRGRVIDLSPSTATKLGMREQGVAMVEVVPVRIPDNPG